METYQLSEKDITVLSSRRNLLAVCDRHGKVLNWIGGQDFSIHPLFLEFFRKRDLRTLMDFSPYTDLGEVPEEFNNFRLLEPVSVFHFLEHFYSILPMVSIRRVRLSQERFLISILILDIMPNYFPERSGGFFLADGAGRLKGFSQVFLDHFGALHLQPAGMLGRPTGDFLSPTPEEIQAKLIGAFRPAPAAAARQVYAKSFDGEPLSGEETLLGSARAESTSAGLSWEALGRESAFLRFAPEFRIPGEDFSAEIELTVSRGQAPVFMAAPEPPKGQPPDFSGYLVGAHGSRPGYVIKKDGYVVHYAEPGQTVQGAGARVRLELRKTGKAFRLRMDGREVLSYVDQDFAAYAPVRVLLALRSGCACLLRRAVLSRSPAVAADPAEPAVELAGLPGKSFRLARFYNYALTTHHPDVKGFFLQNITDMQDRVVRLSAQYRSQLEKGRKLESLLKRMQGREQPFIGSHPAVERLKERARTIAASSATVLIQGATGTGKEVMAAYVHAASGYSKGPFVKVDCSTLPRDLMESELFGHEKGAFTGALSQKTGKLEQAHHGTLFLDEVGNLSLNTQAKLLQFLSDFRVTRVGGEKVIPLDLRVIAASNLPLSGLIEKGLFREDLYYRLCVVVLDLPPLSERREDLPELCYYFLKLFSEQAGKNVRRISPSAMKRLFAYHWPGNIRELRNVLQQAVLFCEGEEVDESLIHVRPSQEAAPASPTARDREHYHCFRDLPEGELEALIRKHHGNLARLAKSLGVTRGALYYQMKRKGMRPGEFRKV